MSAKGLKVSACFTKPPMIGHRDLGRFSAHMSANRMVRLSSGPASKSCRQEARHFSYGSMLLKKLSADEFMLLRSLEHLVWAQRTALVRRIFRRKLDGRLGGPEEREMPSGDLPEAGCTAS
jgi:hypothetical protein